MILSVLQRNQDKIKPIMQKHKPVQNSKLSRVYLIVAGIGIGCLAGLSISPVISIVITSVTGSVAAIITVLSGLKTNVDDVTPAESKTKGLCLTADPAPIAMLVIGLLGGSFSGIWIRTHNLLSPPTATLADEITQWTTAGLQHDTVVNRIFESRYSSSNISSSKDQNTVPIHASVLFNTEAQEECKTLTNLVAKKKYEDLQTELISSSVPVFRELTMIITDTVKLAAIVEKVLCVDIQP